LGVGECIRSMFPIDSRPTTNDECRARFDDLFTERPKQKTIALEKLQETFLPLKFLRQGEPSGGCPLPKKRSQLKLLDPPTAHN